MTKIAVQSIAHAALKTPDLERSLAFYRDTLGFEEMMRINNPDGSLMLVYLRRNCTEIYKVVSKKQNGCTSIAQNTQGR